MVGKFASTDAAGAEADSPTQNDIDLPAGDTGTLHAVVQAKLDLGVSGTLFRLALPTSMQQVPAGQFVLARPCPDDWLSRRTAWSLYTRRPLFIAAHLPQQVDGITHWSVLLPHTPTSLEDPGDQWLRARGLGTRLNLTGPFGRAIEFTPQQRTLLVVSDLQHVVMCLPAIHQMLEQDGRATLILHADKQPPAAILRRIPIPVEVHTARQIDAVQEALSTTLRWADTLLVALPTLSPTWLVQTIRMSRFRLEDGYANYFLPADYLCGFGACLTCVVPAGDGYTRACQHGPFLPLETLSA